GPHTQLAQNILCAYLAGSRFIELKTVQIMDGEELRNCVPRPCIHAQDEGYNVEWSTELTTEEALSEYVKAWFLVHLFGQRFVLDRNVLFNMSVGYSYDGIRSEKIDAFMEGLKDASKLPIFQECKTWLLQNASWVRIHEISPHLSSSITLSTLHGCPREEIEKIAHYLLTEKKLHTYVKCNPTLLGYDRARTLLDKMGYAYVSFDAHHFEEDLGFADAVAMIERLSETAKQEGLTFGLKITNTFPVEIRNGELPGEEMYMSGRALFPLSIEVARLLSEAFAGQLPISYSGGADYFNILDILKTGIRPVTMATTLLKPGGYARFHQLSQKIATDKTIRALKVSNLIVDVKRLAKLSDTLEKRARYRKGYRTVSSRKTLRPLALYDCVSAPCSNGGCPIHQQIPAYLERVSLQQFDKAFEIIVNDNVLPSVTGVICDHNCQNKCVRQDYEDPLQIRQAKKIAVGEAQDAYIKKTKPTKIRTDKKVLIVGAGAAGIAAASYLRRNGVDVTVRERFSRPLGIVSHVIPDFRISDQEIERDVRLAEAYGVRFEYSVPEDFDLDELKKEFDYIILATGAWLRGKSDFEFDSEEEEPTRVWDALTFLYDLRESKYRSELGTRVAVIGGGDVAMDCARAAKRNARVRNVSVVYRRTRAQMPAQHEEIEHALKAGIVIEELLSPVAFVGGTLACDVMELGDIDASGRRAVVPTAARANRVFDTVVIATGAQVETKHFSSNGIALDARGFPILSPENECSVPCVYVAGDCTAGPATVVKAMADAKTIAIDILKKLRLENDFKQYPVSACRNALLAKKGVLSEKTANHQDAARCLSCGTVCEICVDVCPNRANIAVSIPESSQDTLRQSVQIVHLDARCNECGNCATFCPTAGEPYKDKLTVFSCEEDFQNSTNRGFLRIDTDQYRIRRPDGTVQVQNLDAPEFPAEYDTILRALE
ncbi:MAG: putative selenate reductase subunit YgfK, partial [Clostridiales Family XIII bacterium]|nr:putative selenate reductase subunit YgfK [Clostridiales Family XIII bacterium]